jgi:uncharacterized membrane protein
MKPLIVLLTVFGLSCLATFITAGTPNFYFSGRMAMTIMLVFTSIAHFKFNKGMMLMLPSFIPYKKMIIYLTGVIEILLGIGLILDKVRHPIAWIIILFFVLLLPANIYAAKNKTDLEKANYEGKGLSYLWFRIPLQLFFIGWVYYFGLLN